MPTENETPEQRAARLQRERDKAVEWISTKWLHQQCPICEHSTWNVDDVVELRQFEGGTLVLGGQSTIIPLVPITCNNCGYTFFINALKSKTIEPPQGSAIA